MYEAPPCERPAVKVPQRQVEENVYLGNKTALWSEIKGLLTSVRPPINT